MTIEETKLIIWMLRDTEEGADIIKTLNEIYVSEMRDGGMGSLKVSIEGVDERTFGRELVSVDLIDSDQVPLFISVNLDSNGNFFELEIFKGDFSALRKIPNVPF